MKNNSLQGNPQQSRLGGGASTARFSAWSGNQDSASLVVRLPPKKKKKKKEKEKKKFTNFLRKNTFNISQFK